MLESEASEINTTMAKPNISVRLDQEVFDMIQKEADQRGESMAAYFQKAGYMRFNMEKCQVLFDRDPRIFNAPIVEE